MFEFTESERAYLTEMQAIVTDEHGREVLVGLTYEETTAFMSHRRKFVMGPRDHDFREEFLKLHDKHEKARLRLLAMAVELRIRNPSPN